MRSFTSNLLRRNLFNKAPLFQTSKFFHHDANAHGVCLIRKQAPQFAGMSWWKDDFKKVALEDFQGKWVCLFFYPLDFTFVCPTEIVDFENASGEFNKLSKIKYMKKLQIIF